MKSFIFILCSAFIKAQILTTDDVFFQDEDKQSVNQTETLALKIKTEQAFIDSFAKAVKATIDYRVRMIKLVNGSYDLSNNVPFLDSELKKHFWENKV